MIYLLVTILSFLVLLTQQVIEEIELNSQAIFKNCIQSENGNCKLCKTSTFLFKLPQDNVELSLKAGTQICVECPYNGFHDKSNLYCGDCLDNSQTWDQDRICSYDYKTKSIEEDSVFHKVNRDGKQLFYVIESGSKDYTTTMCEGCQKFCKSKSQVCFQVSLQYQYEINNLYIECMEGFAYNEVNGGCDSCPENCQSCEINNLRQVDSDGRVVINTKKDCLICNKGFSLLTTRQEKNSVNTQSQCIPCFSGCRECFFGNNDVDLNTEPWDTYNNFDELILQPNSQPSNEAYIKLGILGIFQRCTECISTTQSTYIPSLDKKTCIRCGTSCKTCEYVSYTLSIDKYPTRNKNTVIDITDTTESEYILRCRECDVYQQTFLATGNGCADCTIQYCKLCHKIGDPSAGADSSFSTLNPDFQPFDKEEFTKEECLLCQDNFYLDQTGCHPYLDYISDPNDLQSNIPNKCLTFQMDSNNKPQCRSCDVKQTLFQSEDTGLWSCEQTCQEKLQDYLCSSCLYINETYRCLYCLDGFYVDIQSGRCKPCSENSFCKECYRFSLLSIHRTEYYLYTEDGEDQIYGPYCYTCTAGDNDRGPILNDDLRYCEKGGQACQIFSAKGNQGYCDICNYSKLSSSITRSSSLDHSDCIECPQFTIGCRIRTNEEINLVNKFFNPTNQKYQEYSTLAFICQSESSYYLDTNLGRCILKKNGNQFCVRSDIINIQADCTHYEDDLDNVLKINSQFNDITQKNTFINLEDKINISQRNQLYIDYNENVVSKLIINLIFQYDSDSKNNKCFFQKNTYFTTNFRRNVFTLKEIELRISVDNAPKNEKIQWFVQNTIYFEYFTTVKLSQIEILPATDLDPLNMYTNIQKYDKPFGFEFIKNDGSKLILENVKISNGLAEDHYQSQQYSTPHSEISHSLKKFKPFYTILLNIYDIQFYNVQVMSQNYLLGSDATFQTKIFGLIYDEDIKLPYFTIVLENVKFYDLSLENQAIFELQDINLSTSPEWNCKIYLKNIYFNDVYFINDGAFLSTLITQKPTGMILIENLNFNNIEFNNSRGIVNFQTMQKVSVSGFEMTNSRVNYTTLFYITTIDISQVYVYNTTFTYFGKIFETQFDIMTIKPYDIEFSGLKLQFTDLEFTQINCLYPACIMLLTAIKNDYELPLNISIKNIIVKQIQSDGFNETIVEAATSAAIQVQRSNKLQVQNFKSIENPNLTIFYTDQVQEIIFIDLKCSQKEGMTIRNNYCVFFNNFYRMIKLIDINLLNLNGIDNSFIGISSWSNLVYNTSSEQFHEQITIENVIVQKCTITTTVLAVPSSAILIDSTQEQSLLIKNLYFQNNRHYSASYLKGTLRPSNPTFLIRSVVGSLILQNSFWKNNYVNGFGAVLYLECGIQIVNNITMINSNYDPTQLINQDPYTYDINKIVEGGHIFMAGYNIQLLNSQFTNSTAKVGGAVYLKTLKEGYGYVNNTVITNAYTSLDVAVVSRGGCIYIDSTYSQLNLLMEYMELSNCIARADGGGIYLITSDRQQLFTIKNSFISNCYGLSGTSIKIKFDDRTQQIQKTRLQDVKISGNYTNALNFFSNLSNFQIIEEFLLLKRLAAFEQNNGQFDIENIYSEGLFFYGLISLINPNLVKINMIESQHGILSYRPYIEIIEPLMNPIEIDSVQFRNISSMNVSVSCTQTTLTNEQNAYCKILLSRVDFPEYIINPAMMLIDQITQHTPLLLKNIFVNRVKCQECYGGLIQVMRISNSVLRQLVQLTACRCSNSQAGYYGCYMLSSAQYQKILKDEDNRIKIQFMSSLTLENIQKYTGLKSRRRRLLQEQAQAADFNYVVPFPTYLAHVVIDSMNIQDIKAVHGGGLSIYGLTVNITNTFCTQSEVSGQGGCIYYEAIPKDGRVVYQRISIATSVFFKNNASIGGAIRVKESGINQWNKTGNTILQNYATLYGDDVAGYPTHLGILIDGKLQQSSNLNNNTGWLHYPLVIKSGQLMSDFQNQTVLLVYLNQNEEIIKYQFDAQSYLSSNFTNSIQGESLRVFNLDLQGFDYSNLQILFDPYQNITLDVTLNSSLVNIPHYHSEYPYQLIGFDTGYTLQARVRSVECDRGEAYNPQQGSCNPCPIGQYVLVYKGICKQINEESMNFTVRNKISMKFSYWRPDHLNDKAEKCKNKPINCFGGYNVGNDVCIEGTIGALCEECDIHGAFWGSKYSTSAKYECGTCQDKTRNLIMIIILSIFTLFTTISSVDANKERIRNWILYSIFAKFGWASSQSASGNVAVLMQILNNHTQILSILQGFQIEIPNQAVDSVNTVSMPAKTVGNALDCFLEEDSWSIDLIYFRIIWSLIMQAIYIIAIFILMFIRDGRKDDFKVLNNLYTMIIYLFLLLQPNYIMEFMTLISSRLISGNLYIMANVSYRYDTFKHDQWIAGFGVPGLLFWLLILPIAFWYPCYLGAQQMKLDSIIFSRSWSFFYQEYRRDRYYWEFIKIFYRSLISVLICYFQEEIIVKGILSFFVVYAYYGLSIHFNPYNLKAQNYLDQLSTVILSLSLVIGVFLYRTIDIDFFGLTYAGYIVIALLNAIFLLLFFLYVFEDKIKELSPKIDEIRDKINLRYPHLQHNPRLRPFLINHTKLNHKARMLWTQLSKVVNQSINKWRQDKSKPLIFQRYVETPASEYNNKINKIHQEFDSSYEGLNLIQPKELVQNSEEKFEDLVKDNN
ncbi:unnamed protein product [Paramecium sonneborni]|uniref:TRP C-terminal domain-containing protein n=1 Tax=Paramecium sonneborni TaxID=65129 RepID=A0A8S1QV95_9CILI|nr:unnamed protein product [Paramecium sonneborni]